METAFCDYGVVEKVMRDSSPEVVFHLAALIGIPYSYVAPRSYVSTNVVGTLNVLEAVRNNVLGTRVLARRASSRRTTRSARAMFAAMS